MEKDQTKAAVSHLLAYFQDKGVFRANYEPTVTRMVFTKDLRFKPVKRDRRGRVIDPNWPYDWNEVGEHQVRYSYQGFRLGFIR